MAPKPNTHRLKEPAGLSRAEAMAVAFCVAWVLVVGLIFWIVSPASVQGARFGGLIVMLVSLLVPVALLGVVAVSARATRVMQAELFALQTQIDALRQMHLAQKAATPAVAPIADAAAEQPMPVPPKPEGPVSGFTSRREVSRLIVPRAAPQAPGDQPALALEPAVEETNPPLERPDLIAALNFPNDEHDTEGFAALRRALRDRTARRLVQASQDVLTLLSQDGIYMDDLHPDPASADLWRRFAKGERGKSMDRLGAVRDRAALGVTAGRMREDTIFRDAVHHFLRRFDQMLVTFEEHATDTDLLALAETRTARAFMLLGRTTGTFD